MIKSDEEIVEAMGRAFQDAILAGGAGPDGMLAAYRVARAHVLDNAITICKGMKHEVDPNEGGDLSRIARYSNGTVKHIIAQLLALKDRTP